MLGKLGLKNNYVTVLYEDGRVSYGGNQSWASSVSLSGEDWEKAEQHRAEQISKYGCGLISAVDIITYLENRRDGKFSDKDAYIRMEDYRRRVFEMERSGFSIWGIFGIVGTRLARLTNRYFRRHHLPYKAKWGMSGRKQIDRIRQMLEADIPATLSVGPGYGHKERLTLYSLQLASGKVEESRDRERRTEVLRSGNLTYILKPVASTKDHYVTVTGIYDFEDRSFFEISSWGVRYFIDISEYREYVRKYDNCIFSNIMYIVPR